MKKQGNAKQVLFENMAKINPDFKVLNEDIGLGQLYYYVFFVGEDDSKIGMVQKFNDEASASNLSKTLQKALFEVGSDVDVVLKHSRITDENEFIQKWVNMMNSGDDNAILP